MMYAKGDKVVIVSEDPGKEEMGFHTMNKEGKMDKWLGKTMTVKKVLSGVGYFMDEDEGEHPDGTGWLWYLNLIDEEATEELMENDKD